MCPRRPSKPEALVESLGLDPAALQTAYAETAAAMEKM